MVCTAVVVVVVAVVVVVVVVAIIVVELEGGVVPSGRETVDFLSPKYQKWNKTCEQKKTFKKN